MNNLKYLWDVSFRNIIRYRLASTIRLISIYLCFLVMLLYLGVFFGAKKRLNVVGNIKDVENRSMVVMHRESEMSDMFCHYSFFADQNIIFYKDKYLADVGLRVVDVDYPDLFENFFSKGDKIVNSESECIVGERIKDKYKVDLGDMIFIKNSLFTVCGITADNLDSGHILISNADVADVGYPRLYFFDDLEAPKRLAENEKIYVHNEIEKYFNMSDDNKKASREVIGICVTVLLYSLVSIYSIHMFYMEKKTVATYVCYCTGVRREIYFTQSLLENLVISISGAIMAYLSVVSLKIPLRSFNLYDFDFPIYALFVVLVFALLTSISLAAKSVRKMK